MKIEYLKVEEDKKNPFEHMGEIMVYTYILDVLEPQENE